MSLIDFVIGKQNLQTLAPAQQDQARAEARRQFIVNSLLGGRGVASGFAAAQGVVPGMQAAEQQRRMSQARQQAMVLTNPSNIGITQTGPGSQAEMLMQENAAFGTDPVVGQRTVEALQSNRNLPRRFDASLFSQIAPTVMDPSKPKDILEVSKMGAGQVQGGLVLDPFNPARIIGSLPTEKDGVQQQFDIGRNTFVANPVQNFSQSRPLSVNTGQQVTPEGRVVNAPNFVAAESERVGATQQATNLANSLFQDVSFIDEDGRTRTRTRFEQMQADGLIPPGLTVSRTQQPGAQGGQPDGGRVTAASPFDTAVTENFTLALKSAGAEVDAARARAVTYDRIEQVYNDPAYDPDSLTPVKAQLTGILRGFGLTGDAADKYLGNFTTVRQAMNQLTLDALQAAKGAISNFEVGFYGETQVRIPDPKQAALFNIAVMRAVGDKAAARQKFLINNRGFNAVSEWDESPEGRASVFENPRVRSFLPQQVVARGVHKGKTSFLQPNGSYVVFD